MAINGQRYDWESITTRMPHGVVIDYEEVNYKEALEVENVYGKGSQPRGYGTGNYSAEGDVTIHIEEFNRLLASLAVLSGTRGYMRHKPFPIMVQYKNDDQAMPHVVVLKACKLTNIEEARKQGDKSAPVKVSFKATAGINRNGMEAVM